MARAARVDRQIQLRELDCFDRTPASLGQSTWRSDLADSGRALAHSTVGELTGAASERPSVRDPCAIAVTNVTVTGGCSSCLLRRVNIYVPDGACCAVLGPSGAGKTTILNLLASRIVPNSGTVDVSGHVGYVMSDARFHAWMTARETLMLAAKCRCPPDQIEDKVAEVLCSTRLEDCADVLVGGAGVPGLSGGQRRRLAVALELLFAENVLLCDEATSGLDAANAEMIARTLRRLAESGRTIVCTIHQPSRAVLAMFSHVVLVADGRVAYCGPSAGAAVHFARIGREAPRGTNPAVWWLRMLQGEPDEPKSLFAPNTDAITAKRTLDRLVVAWTAAAPAQPQSVVTVAAEPSAQAVSWALQFTLLTARQIRVARRDRAALVTGLVKAVIDACFFAMFFPQLDRSPDGVAALISFLQLLPLQQHIEAAFRCSMPLIEELPIVVREHRTGLYPLSAYFASTTVTCSASQMLWSTLLFSVAYPIVALRGSFGAFALTLLTLVLLLLGSQGLAALIAAMHQTRKSVKQVHTAVLTLSFPLMLSNYGLRPQASPVVLRPLFEASPFRHCFDAMAIIQLRGLELEPCSAATQRGCYADGDQVLTDHGLDGVSLAQPMLVLLLWAVVFRLAAYRLFVRGVRNQLRSGRVIGQ